MKTAPETFQKKKWGKEKLKCKGIDCYLSSFAKKGTNAFFLKDANVLAS